MEVDDRQIQYKSFTELEEKVKPFMSESSTIQKSMKRIENIFKCHTHTIKKIKWDKELAHIKDAIDTGEISNLEKALTALIYSCKYYIE